VSALRSFIRVVPEWIKKPFRSLWHVVSPPRYQHYDSEYFAQLDEWQEASYSAIANWIAGAMDPRFVIDVGCGSGGLLSALRDCGVERVLGYEPSDAGRSACAERGLEVRDGDLRRKLPLERGADLVICVEVAEHLDARWADSIVGNLAVGAPVLFSAAPPGQGGHDHVNERPIEYWIEKFDARWYTVNGALTSSLRDALRTDRVVDWYADNVLILEPRVEPESANVERVK